MKIKWEVSNGYAGKSRPQVTKIDDNDILDCDTVDEAVEYVDQCIQEEFVNKITFDAESIVGKFKETGLFDKLVRNEEENDERTND